MTFFNVHYWKTNLRKLFLFLDENFYTQKVNSGALCTYLQFDCLLLLGAEVVKTRGEGSTTLASPELSLQLNYEGLIGLQEGPAIVVRSHGGHHNLWKESVTGVQELQHTHMHGHRHT